MIKSKIILDSISPQGDRLTTFQLVYPRFIHAEMLTHRAFSRNAGSSRAIPIKKSIRQILKDPAIPVEWGKARAGMQAPEQLVGFRRRLCKAAWMAARYPAVIAVKVMMVCRIHKQVANRLLEPWINVQVILSSTDFQNFWDLRCHSDADPTIRAVAELMRRQYKASKPEERIEHLPYLSEDEYNHPDRKQISTARCARVSYLNHDGSNPVISKDISLYYRLAGADPIHASALEHPSTACHGKHGNFNGWKQHRQEMEELLS